MKNLGLLERGQGLRVERGVRGRGWKSGGGIRGEGAHEAADGSALCGAGGGDDGGFDGKGLFGEPELEAGL